MAIDAAKFPKKAVLIRKAGLWEIQWFGLRRLIDFQFESIVLKLKKELTSLGSGQGQWQEGRKKVVLDFGAGRAPWRRLLPREWHYISVDPFEERADHSDLGELTPEFKADRILIIEVLEHLEDPAFVLSKIRSYLKPDGELWVSIPFNARVHGAPLDFWRWTPEGLRILFKKSGWDLIRCEARGGDLTAIISKWIFFWSRRLVTLAGFLPAALALLLSAIPALVVGHLALRLSSENQDDPMGWWVVAKSLGD